MGNETKANTTISLTMNRSLILDDSLDNYKPNSKFIIDTDAAIYDEDDVDTALRKLEKSLDAAHLNETQEDTPNRSDLNTTSNSNREETNNNLIDSLDKVELSEDLYLFKSQKLTFKRFKSFFFVLDSACYLSYYKNKEDSKTGRPIDKICLKNCELTPDVNLSNRKFGINLRVPSTEGMTELSLRCIDENSYARWLSACKLASRNKTIEDRSFTTETNSILNLFRMQQNKADKLASNLEPNEQSMKVNSPAKVKPVESSQIDNENTQANNLLTLRMIKKHKLKQLNDKILEAYSGISHLDLFESKWHYIKAWQALPAYGISYFTVKIKGSRYKEVNYQKI
jgi:hypothetical protein